MADDVNLSGTIWATDELTGARHVQLVKLLDGGDGSTTAVAYNADRGFTVTSGRLVRISVTPTISTGTYAGKDAVGGLLTFANAARFSAGGGHVVGVTIVDKDQERADLDLVLFNQTFTASTDNAVFDPTDADLANVLGVIPVRNWSDFNDNAVGQADPVKLPFSLTGTSLFGQLVVRNTPTYGTTSDLTVVLHILQE